MTDDLKAMSEKHYRAKRAKAKREAMALRISSRGGCPVEIAKIEAVLMAMREAGYRIIEADRIIEYHAINQVAHHGMPGVPDGAMEYARRDLGRQIGDYLTSRGGIEFTERDEPYGREIRADIYVIHAAPPVSDTRDEKD